MGLTIHHSADRLVVELPARVDRHNASAVLNGLMRILNVPLGEGCSEVVLDLRDTTFTDESGPSVLAAVRRGAELLHLQVLYRTSDPDTRRIATGAGLTPTPEPSRFDRTMATR
ncbi:STAS domain-containing protein [Embleya scabrispora]|uniref:STAS domain-containing protein n=1 Tax=Embleya scabrispora TaxID=159449 RepID=UPI0003805726|nr:STAS domain-containing protein [Embleya scabrispora]MYS86257.1 hypothetical protein [Streptomyces sp. SID5474]